MQRLLTWLHRDHQDLLQLIHWLAECDPIRQEADCLTWLRRIQRHVDAHLCIEDEMLFPLLEREKKRHEIMLLRSAHGEVRHAIGKLNGALIQRDWPQFQTEAKNLWREFQKLEAYEHQHLAPMMAAYLPGCNQEILWQACVEVRRRAGISEVADDDSADRRDLPETV